ncbi:hypothetical protein AHiyo4_37720 [Arthrobacter sp. Hiyo4]|nr:hypothetical protein AHiyo4_37720 [Arthrobacter sp. Hiyo4]
MVDPARLDVTVEAEFVYLNGTFHRPLVDGGDSHAAFIGKELVDTADG